METDVVDWVFKMRDDRIDVKITWNANNAFG